jgi:hypothetical protein
MTADKLTTEILEILELKGVQDIDRRLINSKLDLWKAMIRLKVSKEYGEWVDKQLKEKL